MARGNLTTWAGHVFVALKEARHNHKLLLALQPWAQRIHDSEDFARLHESYLPALHVLMLLWLHSPYFGTPSNIVMLLQGICNDIVLQVRRSSPVERVSSLEGAARR